MKEKPLGESGPGDESPWDTSQASLGTFKISILMEKYFVLQIEDVLKDFMSSRQHFQALWILYLNSVICYLLFLLKYNVLEGRNSVGLLLSCIPSTQHSAWHKQCTVHNCCMN